MSYQPYPSGGGVTSLSAAAISRPAARQPTSVQNAV